MVYLPQKRMSRKTPSRAAPPPLIAISNAFFVDRCNWFLRLCFDLGWVGRVFAALSTKACISLRPVTFPWHTLNNRVHLQICHRVMRLNSSMWKFRPLMSTWSEEFKTKSKYQMSWECAGKNDSWGRQLQQIGLAFAAERKHKLAVPYLRVTYR